MAIVKDPPIISENHPAGRAPCQGPDTCGFRTRVVFGNVRPVAIVRIRLAALWGQQDDVFVGLALFREGDHLAVALADGRIRLWGPAA